MYINKRKKGFGYFSTVKSKNKNGEEVTGFLDVNFKQGTEPEEESIKGELYFMGENGEKRKAFFNAFKKNDGSTAVGLFLLGPENKSVLAGFKVEEIKPDDLPFY